VRDGFRYVLQVPELRISFIMLAVIGVLTYNFSVTFPLLVTRSLHGSATTFTLVYSAFSAGSLVGALLVAHRSRVRFRAIVLAAAAMGGIMVVLALVPTPLAAVPVAVALGVAAISYMTTTTAIVQLIAKSSMHGRVLALQTVLMIGTTPLGGPLLGAIADAWGARIPIAIGAVGALGASAYGWTASRSIRHAEAADHGEAESPAVATESIETVEQLA
jgi:MFS family permease